LIRTNRRLGPMTKATEHDEKEKVDEENGGTELTGLAPDADEAEYSDTDKRGPSLKVDEEDTVKEKEAGDDKPFDVVDLLLTPLLSFLSTYLVPILILCYCAFFIAALAVDAERALTLVYITVVVVVYLLTCFFAENRPEQWQSMTDAIGGCIDSFVNDKYVSENMVNFFGHTTILILCFIGFLIFICVDIADDPIRFVSLIGQFVFIFLCYICSWNRNKIVWRPVIWGFVLQWILALFILRTDPGYDLFDWLGEQVTIFLEYSEVGAQFVFGEVMYEHFFAFVVLSTVIFFSSVVSIFYYMGALQFIIVKIAWVMKYTLGTSTGESLNAAGNIFVGQTEAPLLIAPFIGNMSSSEIHAVMTGGFATIAGGVLAAYILMGIPAEHLIAASVMSAPAALATSKIIFPEDDESKKDEKIDEVVNLSNDMDADNIFEAAAKGALTAIPLAANIAAMLIAFLGILAWFDAILGWAGNFVDYPELSFEKICGWVFWPLSFLMGVPIKDCEKFASLLGLKTFANEFVAYAQLDEYIESGDLSDRSVVIATYALCGFANFGSMGIQLGGLTPLAPERSKLFAQLVFSAMISGTVACFMTACIAGVLYVEK